MFTSFVNAVTGNGKNSEEKMKKIEAIVVLMKKNVLDFVDPAASARDRIKELLGNGIGFQLISADHGDPEKGNRGVVGDEAYLEDWITTIAPLAAGESTYKVTFNWDESFGKPGAFIVKNNHHSEFLLKTVTLSDVPGTGRLHFVCNSWIYPAKYYKHDRVFFANQSYLPGDTPVSLQPYREEELAQLRGNGEGELKEWDRVYDYAFYNDLGDPDRGPDYARPVLGGSKQYPYPRRGRTGRKPTKTDPETESRLPLLSLDIYVPRDERFGHIKMSDFLAYALKSIVQFLVPEVGALFDKTPNEFDTLKDVMNLYKGGLQLPQNSELAKAKNMIPLEMIRELVRSDGEQVLKFPLPQVIQANEFAWRTDEEFAREMLAGVNPVVIRRLEVFPPVSKLDRKIYGNQNSRITAEHVEKNLQGMTVFEAIEKKKLFILDHHDSLMPYVNRINSTTSTKLYASRTILFLKEDGTLTPLAIELSLPNPEEESLGPLSKVFTPANHGVEGSIWQLAKAYVAVNDSGYHQLISHWLETHAAIEPFVIATNRQLSVMHPMHKLLNPHYRDTMNINALARQILINGGGILELTVFPRQYSMEMSSVIYKDWVFTEQGLPANLLKRGVAVHDPSKPHKVRLLIEDYPYAVDGLEIWSAIEKWVEDYCAIYYPSDESVKDDPELQAWWKEVREKGHGDKSNEPWWPKMQTLSDLTQSCTTIIWIASALHAAVNFGQYPYAGYLPNRPTISRRFMPEVGTKDYAELEANPDKVFLSTITSQFQTVIGISLIEILSKHSSDEVYLGQRANPDWTTDGAAVDAFAEFGKKLVEIEERIIDRNNDLELKNRMGPVKVPYTLLYPNTSDFTRIGGLTGRGIPNSVSI